MAARRQIVLDRKTEKLLDEIENDPAFQRMIAKSDADISAGRGVPHEEVVRAFRARNKKSTDR
jgi:hypothetical protein